MIAESNVAASAPDLVPRQRRSQQTQDRLLAATIALLREHGLPGCTVPAVAGRAGVAVGTVYRRYLDKDRLLAEAILSLVAAFPAEGRPVLARQVEQALTGERLLIDFAATVIRAVQRDRVLLIAVRDFVGASADLEFVRRYRTARDTPRQLVSELIFARFGDEIVGGKISLVRALASIYTIASGAYIEPDASFFVQPVDPEGLANFLGRMHWRELISCMAS